MLLGSRSFVRLSLFCYHHFVSSQYAAHRFSSLASHSPSLAKDLNHYLLNIVSLPGSGEYSVSSLLHPGAFARLPLAPRLGALGKDVGGWDGGVEVTFAYGEKDWMDGHGGKEAVRAMRANGNKKGEVVIVPEAGHQYVMTFPANVRMR